MAHNGTNHIKLFNGDDIHYRKYNDNYNDGEITDPNRPTAHLNISTHGMFRTMMAANAISRYCTSTITDADVHHSKAHYYHNNNNGCSTRSKTQCLSLLVPNDCNSHHGQHYYHRKHYPHLNSQQQAKDFIQPYRQQCCSIKTNISDSLPTSGTLVSSLTTQMPIINLKKGRRRKERRKFLLFLPLMFNKDVIITKLILISTIILTIVMNITDGHDLNVNYCPNQNLLLRLITPNGAPVNRFSSSPMISPGYCHCEKHQEGGWLTTCYANDFVHNEEEDLNAKNMADNLESETDYVMTDFDELPTLFTVRHDNVQQIIKINCDKGTPAFKPALFQGFGIDTIDQFVISKCELPQTLPLSVILYRTQTNGFPMTSTVGSHSFSINTTGQQTDIVSPIRTLVIESPKRISIKQLNILLSDLESLEELKLSNFDLNDIDHYGIEMFGLYSHASSATINGFNIVDGKRVKRNDYYLNDSVIETTVAPPPSTTTTIATITADNAMTTTILPDLTEHININNNSVIHNGSSLLSPSMIDKSSNDYNLTVSDNKTTINATSRSFDNDKDEISTTTTIKTTTVVAANTEPPTTINPDTGRDLIEDITTNFPEINYDEDNINDVNLENKPVFVFDENVLNFARILPNLKVLMLNNFVKESRIPNVLFQILKGLNKLQELHLNSNNLNTVPNDALAFAGHSLKRLYLQRNSIQEIDENAFRNLTQLEILDISHNQLGHINEQTFQPLKNLHLLRMIDNRFQNLSENLFQNNWKLMSLDLSQNGQLQSLPTNLFHGLNNLSNLSLAYCGLPNISHDVRQFFRNIPSLSKLDLKGNQLTNLTANGLFAWNSRLTKLDLSSNKINELSANIFTMNASRLEEINLNKNQLKTLPENLFQYTRNVRKLSISYNLLTKLLPSIFLSMKLLEELNLSHNNIFTINIHNDIDNLPFGISPFLRIVDLSYNNLTDFDSNINRINWSIYISFSEMNLRNNKFSGPLRLQINNLASKELMVKFDLSSNFFTTVDVDDILSDITITDKSQSQITETTIRLDNNPFECDCSLFQFLNYSKSINGLYNENRETIIRRILFLSDSNKVVCHKPERLKNHPLHNLNLDELICNIDNVCPFECDCIYKSADQSAVIDCDNHDYSTIPEELELLEIIKGYNASLDGKITKMPKVNNVIYKFGQNNIQSIESLSPMIFWNDTDSALNRLRPKFVDVYLNDNNITELDKRLISDEILQSSIPIRKLALQNNNIQKIPMKIVENFETLSSTVDNPSIKSRLYLGNNPFNCYNDPAPPGSECYVRDLKQWLSSHSTMIGDVNQIRCDPNNIDMQRINEANSSLVIVNMNDDLLCPVFIPPTSNGTLMALSIICFVLATLLFIVSVLYYRNKQTILAFIYIHLNPIFVCLSFTEDDLDEEKIYDAFVSYSSSDRDIVMELIEKLEKPHDMNEVSLILQNGLSLHEGKADQVVPENVFKKSSTLKSSKPNNDVEMGNDSPYRLCIHERDWLPGNLISWNIVNSVQNSKRTILILSENFIKSIWFQVEFHTAYYQMLEDKMDRLIVIVRGELPPKDQLDKDLNFLLTTKTYLVWGEKWFWEKLYYAMPHKKKQPVKNKSEKDKLTSSFSNNKYNGSLNGRVNGINEGILKWSNQNNSKPNAKTEAMKDYVDKTIASHFQLNSYSPPTNPSPSGPVPETNGNVNTTTNNNNNKPAPKSLRNSGTLATATPNTLKAIINDNGGFDNKSFIDETNT